MALYMTICKAVKLFTHTDLDGIGCAILAFQAFGRPNVDVEFLSYNSINQRVKEFILNGEIENYDEMYITDLSVTPEVAELIDSHITNSNHRQNVILIDHHKTAEWLHSSYWWAFVKSEDQNEIPISGTSLFYNYLLATFRLVTTELLTHFVEMVRRYDTWEWKRLKDVEPNLLNCLFGIYGRSKFIDHISLLFHDDARCSTNVLFDDYDYEQLEIDEVKKLNVVNSALAMMQTYNSKLGLYGTVYAEQYVSTVADTILEMYPKLDFIAVLSKKNTKISLRTNKDVDVSKIAKFFGGGGHAKSSGFYSDKETFLQSMLKWEENI